MAQKFAAKGIAIDATHGTTSYDFLLTTIMVIDEFGQGFPVAWCLFNHEDFTHMCIFYRYIKQNCGTLCPTWIMSDTAGQFYNAWVGIMGGKPSRLLCTWHVDRAWQEELRSKVKDLMVAAEIYKMLRTVLQETDNVLFQDYFNQLLRKLPSLNPDFNAYFLKEWAEKKEMWVYRYRKGMGINTNIVVEAFHRVFKYNYLKGKVNKRVDKCLINLLKFVRDKLFQRFVKLTKGRSCNKIKVINDRHSRAMKLSVESVEDVEEGKWSVKSEDI